MKVFFISNASWEGCFYPKDITIYVTRIGPFFDLSNILHIISKNVSFISKYQKRLPPKIQEKVIEILHKTR